MKTTHILLIILILAIGLLAGLLIGSTAYNTQKSPNIITGVNNNIENITNISSSPTWHKIKTYNGVNDDTFSINAQGSKLKVVSTGMPIKNYADNSLNTIVNQNYQTLGKSQSLWNSHSAVKTKTETIIISGSGTFNIEISAYELQWWTVEVYEYY